MELSDLQDQLGEGKEQRISSKVIRVLSLDAESERLGNINPIELKTLFNLKVKNALYFNDGNVINKLIDSYLNLSVSKNGKLLDNFKEMFKSAEITTKQTVKE